MTEIVIIKYHDKKGEWYLNDEFVPSLQKYFNTRKDNKAIRYVTGDPKTVIGFSDKGSQRWGYYSKVHSHFGFDNAFDAFAAYTTKAVSADIDETFHSFLHSLTQFLNKTPIEITPLIESPLWSAINTLRRADAINKDIAGPAVGLLTQPYTNMTRGNIHWYSFLSSTIKVLEALRAEIGNTQICTSEHVRSLVMFLMVQRAAWGEILRLSKRDVTSTLVPGSVSTIKAGISETERVVIEKALRNSLPGEFEGSTNIAFEEPVEKELPIAAPVSSGINLGGWASMVASNIASQKDTGDANA